MAHAQLPSPTPGYRVAAGAVLAVAAGLRFGGITAGTPYRIGNDEPFVVGTALRILETGDFNPHFFDYGGLAIYLHVAVAVLRFLAGAIDGQWTSTQGLWIGDFLAASRVVTAAIGTLTVWLVYRAGLRFGAGVAVVGALLMAVLPQHVRESHFALTDAPLTLLTTATFLLALRAIERRHLAAVVGAAFVAGLAASVKYNGAVALLMPIGAAAVLPAGQRLAGAGLALLAGTGGFVLGSPYAVLDLPGFLNGFAHLAQGYNQGRPMSDAAVVYAKHLRNWFAWPAIGSLSLGYPALAAALAGAVLAARHRRGPAGPMGVVLLIGFPVVWFTMLSRQGSLQYGRYLLPLAPMLCLWIATTLVAVWTKASTLAGRAPRATLQALVVLLVMLPVGAGASWVREHRWPRTEELASMWIVDNVPADETVVVEAAAVLLPPGVTVYQVGRLVDRPADSYGMSGPVYLVSTAAETDRYFATPDRFQNERATFEAILARADPVATFEPGPRTPGPALRILRIRP